MWNLLCSKTIYIKGKKKYKRNKKKVTTVATMPPSTVVTVQNLNKIKNKNKKGASPKLHCRCIAQKHCMRICAFIYKKKEHKSKIERKKKYILNKPKVL